MVVFHMTPVQRRVRVVGVQHQPTPVWPTTLGKPALRLTGVLYLHHQAPQLLPTAARQRLRGSTVFQ